MSGCWGEQIVILNCEDQLLNVLGAIEILDFLGGSSVNDRDVPLDVAFVEGSVANEREARQLQKIRERSRHLVACGTCACFGGVGAMETGRPRKEIIRDVYGLSGPAVQWDIGEHRPLSDFVPVNLQIPGCPMEKSEFLQATASLLNGDLPVFPSYPVCQDCKMNEQDCLLVGKGMPCAGPVTMAGCGARCPGYNVPCIGCRGPVEEANEDSLEKILAAKGVSAADVRARLRTFATRAEERRLGA